jgi:hypothetical protein
MMPCGHGLHLLGIYLYICSLLDDGQIQSGVFHNHRAGVPQARLALPATMGGNHLVFL